MNTAMRDRLIETVRESISLQAAGQGLFTASTGDEAIFLAGDATFDAAKIVDAVLAELRTPSPEMLTPFAYLESWQMPGAKGQFTAMIDAIAASTNTPQLSPRNGQNSREQNGGR